MKKCLPVIWQFILIAVLIWVVYELPYNLGLERPMGGLHSQIDIFISLFFAFDFYLQKIHWAEKLITGRVERKRRSKCKKIFWYTIHFLSIIPFEAISYYLEDSVQIIGDTFADIITFATLIRLLKLSKIFHTLQLFDRIYHLPKFFKVLGTLLMVSCIVHWVSLGHLLINVQASHVNLEEYIKALYWSVTTLTTVGYGDIVPTTSIGRLFTMGIMILGVGMYGIVIGYVSRLVLTQDHLTLINQEKIRDVTTFMRHYGVPEDLRQEVITFYKGFFDRHLSNNDESIIIDLPSNLQHELLHYKGLKLLLNIDLFRFCNRKILNKLASSLEKKTYSSGHYVLRKGDIGEEMYIIHQGNVEVILDDGAVIANFGDGDFFGEMALLNEIKRNANVRVKSYTEIYILSNKIFEEIVGEEPILLDLVKKEMSKRHKKIKS